MKRILLAGSTGLIGRLVLDRLLARAERDALEIIAVGRRPPPVEHARLKALELADQVFSTPRTLPADPVDTFISCLGTTLQRAGSREAFAAVDHDLVLKLAGFAKSRGARQAILVSSVGASPTSRNFYLRVKGETERDLAGLGFERLDVIQPGLLIGARDEHRPGESFAQRIAPLTDRLMPGPLRRYRSIQAESVAAAIDALAAAEAPGHFVHRHDELARLAPD